MLPAETCMMQFIQGNGTTCSISLMRCRCCGVMLCVGEFGILAVECLHVPTKDQVFILTCRPDTCDEYPTECPKHDTGGVVPRSGKDCCSWLWTSRHAASTVASSDLADAVHIL